MAWFLILSLRRSYTPGLLHTNAGSLNLTNEELRAWCNTPGTKVQIHIHAQNEDTEDISLKTINRA